MPDSFDQNGLQVKTLTELRDELVSAMQTIYGPDISVDQDDPDGQQINIFAQQAVDLRELLVKINASFDPEQAEGVFLDQRVAINGISRIGATFTFTQVEITLSEAAVLEGLDDDVEDINGTGFTVKDGAGNRFILVESRNVGPGVYDWEFRAAEIGSVDVAPNTITIAETIIPGVTSINNPSAPIVVGQDAESDAELRIRRRKAITIASTGYLDSIQAAIAEVDGVTTSIVLENNGSIPDANEIPAHSIWAIVEGGADADIANTIYSRKSSGSGMKGSVQVDILRPDGTFFEALFDRPINQNLWISLDVTLSNFVVDVEGLKALIVSNVLWDVGGDAESGDIFAYLKELNPNYQIMNVGVSDNGIDYVEILSPTTPQHRFLNSTDRITINNS